MDEGAPHSEGEAQAGGQQAGGLQAGGPQAGGPQAGGLQLGGPVGSLVVAWSFTARVGGANSAATAVGAGCGAATVGAGCGAAAVGAGAAHGASVRLTLGWASAQLVCATAGRRSDSLLRGTLKSKLKTPCKQTENLTSIDLTFIEHAIQ